MLFSFGFCFFVFFFGKADVEEPRPQTVNTITDTLKE